MELLAKVFEVLNNRVALPIALFCGFLLFVPASALEYLQLATFVQDNRTILALFFLFSTISYGYEKGKVVIAHRSEKKKNRQARQDRLESIAKSLDALDENELAWIQYCLRDNTRTLAVGAVQPTAKALQSKGIVSSPHGYTHILETPYTITDLAWDYLQEHKDDFYPPERRNDRQFNQNIDSHIGDLFKLI